MRRVGFSILGGTYFLLLEGEHLVYKQLEIGIDKLYVYCDVRHGVTLTLSFDALSESLNS